VAAFLHFILGGVVALVLLLAHAAAASSGQSAIEPNIYLTQNQGFCSPGAFEPIKLAPGQPAGLKKWGSFCQEGDKGTGVAETSPFLAPRRIGLYLAGYASQPGLSLEIENPVKASRLPILPHTDAAEQWLRYDVRLPASWKGDSVRLIARDRATGIRGWFAFTEPVSSSGVTAEGGEAIRLLLRTLLYFVLTILPALAIGTFAIRRGVCDLVLVGLVELAAIGASGYLGFCLFFIAPKLGHIFSFLLPIACGLWLAWNYWRLGVAGRRIASRLFVPLALIGAASLLILSAGFMYGGFNTPSATAGQRFSHALPGDNGIPYLFAEALKSGHIPKLQAGWLSSDRPPLQTGLVLSEYTYTSQPREFDYTIISVILQSLWILAAWLLLTAFNLNARAITLVVAVCLFSGFVFLNSFFVWPKLLAAAYILASLAILLTPKYVSLRHGRIAGILVGAMLALAMLSHGGSAFAILGIALTMAILRTRLPITSLLLIVATGAALYAPWMLYQKFCDPPGNRLLKMHLAGVDNVDPRPFSQTLIDAYRALTPKEILENKVANVRRLFEYSGEFWIETKNLITHIGDRVSCAALAAQMRGWMFFFFVANLGFLGVGPLALLAGIRKQYRGPEWRAAAIMWVFIPVTAAAWCLLMFGPATTVIHQGTYAIVLLGYAGSILAIWAFSRFLALAIGCLQVLLSGLLYFVFMQAAASNALLAEPPLLLGCLVLCAVSLICLFWLLYALSRPHIADLPCMHQELAVALSPGDRTLH